jgi:hypothetical protein
MFRVAVGDDEMQSGVGDGAPDMGAVNAVRQRAKGEAGTRMAKRTVTRRQSCYCLASEVDTVGEPARAAAGVGELGRPAERG